MHYVFRQINISMLIQSAILEEIQSTVQDVFLRALSNAINMHINEALDI